MSPTELLAKIDALDWERTVSPDTTVLADHNLSAMLDAPPRRQWSVAQFGIVAALLCVAATLLYVGLNLDRSAPVGGELAPPVVVAPPVVETPVAPGVESPRPDEAAAKAAAQAAEEEAAKVARAKTNAERAAAYRAEKQRKAKEAAEQARLEQQQRDEARLRAEREAEQARIAAAKAREPVAVPKGSSSPKELCNTEASAFSRGMCEARACGMPEWQSHPFCQKRLSDQLRMIGG